jgi:hypothetical protein
LDSDPEGRDTCSLDLFDAIRHDWDGPLVADLFIEGFVKSSHVLWGVSGFVIAPGGESLEVP